MPAHTHMHITGPAPPPTHSLPRPASPTPPSLRPTLTMSSTTNKKKSAAASTTTTSITKEIKEAFGLFDTDGSGFIDAKELKVALRALGFSPTKEEMVKFLADVDSDDGSSVSYAAFEKLAIKLMSTKSGSEEIKKAFTIFAGDKGCISFQDLKKVARDLGENMTDEELQEMIDEASGEGDGFVNLQDFTRIMQKTKLF